MTLNEESASKGLKDNANFQLKNVVLHQEKKIASKHTKRDLWVVVCSQCPMNYSNVMHTLPLTKEALPPYAYLAIMRIMLQAFRPIA